MYGLKNYNFQIVEPNSSKAITSGLKVKVLNAGGDIGTNRTVYADDIKTALTNPITMTAFDALGDGVVSFWDTPASVDIAVINDKGMSKLFTGVTPVMHSLVFDPDASEVDKKVSFEFFEDFRDGYVSADRWTLATDLGGTMTIDDTANGIGSLLTGGTDEDGSTLSSTDEIFLATTKKLHFEARVICTEAATNKVNIFVGLADISTVDLMVDAAAGPAATLDGIGFYKVDSNLYWEFQASNATSKDDNSDMVAYASNTWYTLEFDYDEGDGTTAKITPKVNGVAYDAVDLTISGMAEMNAALSAKAGSTAAETLKCDYIRVRAER